MELTPRQEEILAFIKSFRKLNGHTPTIREIGIEFGMASTNGVVCHLRALAKKGVIIRRTGISRGIAVVGGESADPVSKFALISTVDSKGPNFPSHCVILFDSERDAVQYAVGCIMQHEPKISYIEDEASWVWDGDHYHNPGDLLDEWQSRLDVCEYFHVKPVKSLANLLSTLTVESGILRVTRRKKRCAKRNR